MKSAAIFKLLSTLILSSLFLTACGTGKQPERFDELANQGTHSLCLNNDGSFAFAGSIHHGGSLWRLQPFDRLFNWNHQAGKNSSIVSCDFSPEGNFVATTDSRTIALWNSKTGEAIWLWNAPGDIHDISLSSNGQYALLAMADYTATLFDIKNGGIKRTLRHDGIVFDVSIDQQGNFAASASDDSSARIWDLNSGKQVQRLEHGNQVRSAEISADGRWVFTSALGDPGRLWDNKTGEIISEFPINSGFYSSIRFNEDGSKILTGSSAGKIQLWETKTAKLEGTWQAVPRNKWVSNNVLIEDVAFAKQGYIASGSNGRIYYLE
ncbi:MAG: WD40 repeat protein [Oleispira sp.]|jgi:WD40 repeat protein